MPAYRCEARDPSGKFVSQIINAANEEEVVDKLQKMGYMATKITETLSDNIKRAPLFNMLGRVSSDDLILFNIQLSNMINAGLTLLISLNTLGKQIENTRLKKAVNAVSSSVAAGKNFSNALALHPKVFPKLFISMVKAGEATGKLGAVLNKFSEYLEHQASVKQQIKGLVLYPLVIVCFSVLLTLFLSTFIIPKFAEMFQSNGVPLPFITIMLYKIGMAIRRFWYLIVLFVVLLGVAMKKILKTEKGGFILDKAKLRFPLIGPLYRKIIISRVCNVLAILFSSGVPALETLVITKEVVGNEVLARVLADVHESVRDGEKMSTTLSASKEFPSDVVQMISVGEDTGKLGEMLGKVSEFYDKAIAYAIKKFITILEPVLLSVVGVIVGFIMISMLLPIFSMSRLASG